MVTLIHAEKDAYSESWRLLLLAGIGLDEDGIKKSQREAG